MKKLLLLLLIAVVGAGIAFGANAAFFSTASSDRPLIEPRGLIDDIVIAAESEPTPKPSASPSPSPQAPVSAEGSSTFTSSGNAAPPPVDDGDGPRDPRTPSNSNTGPDASTSVIQGVWDGQGNPEEPCDLEESERDQRQCENEADREEDEAEQEADEGDSGN